MAAASNGYRATAHRNGGYRAHWKCSGDCPRGLRDGFCREHSKTGFATKTAAKKFAKEQHESYKTQSWTDKQKVAITVAEAAERWLDSRVGVRANTLAQNRSVVTSLVLPYFGAERINTITTRSLKKWVAALVADGKSAATISKAHTNLFQLLDNAQEDGLVLRDQLPPRLHRSQLPKNEPPKVQPFTLDELMMLADIIDPRYRIVVFLGGLVGLRIGEVLGLQPSHLVHKTGAPSVLHIVQQLGRNGKLAPTKTKASERHVPISALVEQELNLHLKLYPVSTLGTVVSAPGSNGGDAPGPVDHGNFRERIWVPAMRQMAVAVPGFQYKPIHQLRHTYASLLATNGENSKTIAAHLGHTSTRVTDDLYSHLMDDGLGNSGAHTIDRLAGSVFSPDPAVNATNGIYQGAFIDGKILVNGYDPHFTPAPGVIQPGSSVLELR